MLHGFWKEEPLRHVSVPVIKPSSRHTEPQSPNDDPTPQVRRFDSGSSGESDSVPQRGGSFSRGHCVLSCNNTSVTCAGVQFTSCQVCRGVSCPGPCWPCCCQLEPVWIRGLRTSCLRLSVSSQVTSGLFCFLHNQHKLEMSFLWQEFRIRAVLCCCEHPPG